MQAKLYIEEVIDIVDLSDQQFDLTGIPGQVWRLVQTLGCGAGITGMYGWWRVSRHLTLTSSQDRWGTHDCCGTHARDDGRVPAALARHK